MADDTDTTRPGEAEAVEAVRWLLLENRVYLSATAFAADLIAVVYPVIAAAVREQAAQERMHGDHQFQPGIDTDMIAEGRQPDPRWCNICGGPR